MKSFLGRMNPVNGVFTTILWVLVGAIAVVIPGCEHDEENEYQEVNDWIYENMSIYYFWNDQIPKSTNKTLEPQLYFNTLLSKNDRFSWIQDNFTELMEFLSGVTTEAGYDFGLFTLDNINVIGYITYIKPETPAETAGLKRGDFFSSIDGTNMTIENYSSLLEKMSKQHTLGKMVFSGGVATGQTVAVPLSVIVYKENPILLDTIYHIQNKKIGYFVYNFFARDSEDNGIGYEKELNNLFGEYKSEGIDELIIDLRYNSGGSVLTATALASMVSNRSVTDIFGYQKYNSQLESAWVKEDANFNKRYFLDYIERYDDNDRSVEKVSINKLSGLNKLHLIVTNRSASASELLINGLKPHMDVVLIGDTTTGKNVGSITIYEDDPEKQKHNNWGMQPIVLKFENANHFSDYADGFVPDIHVWEEEIGMKPLGDIHELMLSKTLDHILGITSTIKKSDVTQRIKIIGSSIDLRPWRKNMYFEHRIIQRQSTSQ